MFEFLKNHFEYYTFNSWNNMKSIANNVKLYNLGLSGDWATALEFLEAGEYDTVSFMIEDFEREHPGYAVFFNGRSNGYLMLCNKNGSDTILPYCIDAFDTYEDYKEYCREDYCGSVKANRDELVFFTKLVQDFDKFCDELRDFCNELSNMNFEATEMKKSVEQFNDQYEDDLELLGFSKVGCDNDGNADLSEIRVIRSLLEAFYRIADRSAFGYRLKSTDDGIVYYEN
jgi:hypothetical protein